MKTVLVAIDSKFIHTNLAIRYLKANTTYDTDLLEFTIKDSVSLIVERILAAKVDIVAFSVYIWNLGLVQSVTPFLKNASSNLIVIWGGPEVSFDASFFLENHPVDYLVQGEGEIAFHLLLEAIHNGRDPDSISGVAYLKEGKLHRSYVESITDLNGLNSPYSENLLPPDLSSKITYVETSRGCPFKCTYCLASLERGVRYRDLDLVKRELLQLMSSGARTFKFLDRTFNASPKYALEVFDFLIEHHQTGMSFQFEITGDILKREIIDHLNRFAPKGLFRFEIGIQSTNESTNLAVERIQNNETLFENIKAIRDGGIIDMHLDLIAGLPYEDLSRFKETFDQVFALNAKELQLGFLKMLRGTKIRSQADKYGYVYDSEPPYEIIRSDDLSSKDLEVIHRVEEMLEIFWNKGFMNQSVRYLSDRVPSAFSMFLDLHEYLCDRGFEIHRYQLYELFRLFEEYVKSNHPLHHLAIFSLLKREYLLRHRLKPKIWWDTERIRKSELFKPAHEEHPEYSLDSYYKYGVITDCFDGKLVVLYLPEQTVHFEIKA